MATPGEGVRHVHVYVDSGTRRSDAGEGRGQKEGIEGAGAGFRKPALSRVRRAFPRSLCKFGVGLRPAARCRWPRRRRVCTRAAASSAVQHTTERERQRQLREAAGGSTEPAAEEATDVEAVTPRTCWPAWRRAARLRPSLAPSGEGAFSAARGEKPRARY